MRPSHSTRGVAELLLSQGGPHAAAFALGFSGERDTPLRINELDLPWMGVEDDVDDAPASGFRIAVLSGWVHAIGARLRRPTLAPHT